MATYYARSSLIAMGDTTGWSLTSGGASAGVVPPGSSDIVFDANSGVSRSVSGSLTNMRDFTTVGAAAMTFTGTIDCSRNINLTGTASAYQVNMGTGTISAPGVVIGTLYGGIGRTTMVAGSDLNAKELTLSWATNSFDSSAYRMTFGSVKTTDVNISLTLGSGVWILTGEGKAADTPNVWNVTSGGFGLNQGTSTIKLSSVIAAQLTFDGLGRTYNNVWAASSGAGARFTGTGDTFENFRIEPGSLTEIAAGKTVKASSFTLDGMGVMTTLRGGGGAATLEALTSSTVYANYCNIQNLYASGLAAFRALNSVNQGGNLSWEFVPNNSRFLQFF